MNPALDSRARFEAHRLEKTGRRPRTWGAGTFSGDEVPPRLQGKYVEPIEQAAWEAWQAAIASMWLPIETVPTDGSMFIVWFAAVRFEEDEDGKLHEHDASTADFAAWRADPEHGGYVDCFGAPHGDGGGPTHWQPITPPIAALAAKEPT